MKTTYWMMKLAALLFASVWTAKARTMLDPVIIHHKSRRSQPNSEKSLKLLSRFRHGSSKRSAHLAHRGFLHGNRSNGTTVGLTGARYVRIFIEADSTPGPETSVSTCSWQLKDVLGNVVTPVLGAGTATYCGDDGSSDWVSGTPPFDSSAPCVFASSWGPNSAQYTSSSREGKSPIYAFSGAEKGDAGAKCWFAGGYQSGEADGTKRAAWLAYDFGPNAQAKIDSMHLSFWDTDHSASDGGQIEFQTSEDGTTWNTVDTIECSKCKDVYHTFTSEISIGEEVHHSDGTILGLTEFSLTSLEAVSKVTKQMYHNSVSSDDMLQTTTLATGQTSNMLRILADSVAKMKQHVADLEVSLQLCQKKVADFKEGGAP